TESHAGSESTLAAGASAWDSPSKAAVKHWMSRRLVSFTGGFLCLVVKGWALGVEQLSRDADRARRQLVHIDREELPHGRVARRRDEGEADLGERVSIEQVPERAVLDVAAECAAAHHPGAHLE